MGTHTELMEQAKAYSYLIKSFYQKTGTKEGIVQSLDTHNM